MKKLTLSLLTFSLLLVLPALAQVGVGFDFEERARHHLVCDDDGPFIREIVSATPGKTTTNDYLLASAEPYTPNGKVTICAEVASTDWVCKKDGPLWATTYSDGSAIYYDYATDKLVADPTGLLPCDWDVAFESICYETKGNAGTVTNAGFCEIIYLAGTPCVTNLLDANKLPITSGTLVPCPSPSGGQSKLDGFWIVLDPANASSVVPGPTADYESISIANGSRCYIRATITLVGGGNKSILIRPMGHRDTWFGDEGISSVTLDAVALPAPSTTAYDVAALPAITPALLCDIDVVYHSNHIEGQ